MIEDDFCEDFKCAETSSLCSLVRLSLSHGILLVYILELLVNTTLPILLVEDSYKTKINLKFQRRALDKLQP